MSEESVTTPAQSGPDAPVLDYASSAKAESPAKSFVGHARLISLLTLISRFFGVAREVVSAHYLGAGVVASAFAWAFSIPNMFRKLFGEGALSAAFIPLYAQSIKHEHPEQAAKFAAASVNVLCLILLGITLIGELALGGAIFLWRDIRLDWLLALKLTAVMLPYVLLICLTAFLGSILQVHKRFGAPAAAPILLNAIHIGVLLLGGWYVKLQSQNDPARVLELQTELAYWLAFFVLVAGVLQIFALAPSLKAVGFHFTWVRDCWTPSVKRMLKLTVPVAPGAGVLQLSVLMDKGLAMVLARGIDSAGHPIEQMQIFGHSLSLPMETGAVVRLSLAQLLYQFPLGVFAIALATAIFPKLSADAMNPDRTQFKEVLRQGIEATMFEGLAASAGLILVRYPVIQVLFQHGKLTAADTELIARSLMLYATGIWAFSLLQIISRAYYAMHDARTPLVMTVWNIIINLVVELPLVWTGLGESGMAVGTSVSFAIQALVMLWILDRRVGGLHLSRVLPSIGKMMVATLVMCGLCWSIQYSPLYPQGNTRLIWSIQLTMLMLTGAISYLGTCAALGVTMMDHFLPRRFRRKQSH